MYVEYVLLGYIYIRHKGHQHGIVSSVVSSCHISTAYLFYEEACIWIWISKQHIFICTLSLDRVNTGLLLVDKSAKSTDEVVSKLTLALAALLLYWYENNEYQFDHVHGLFVRSELNPCVHQFHVTQVILPIVWLIRLQQKAHTDNAYIGGNAS
jgi:hypothetical protein